MCQMGKPDYNGVDSSRLPLLLFKHTNINVSKRRGKRSENVYHSVDNGVPKEWDYGHFYWLLCAVWSFPNVVLGPAFFNTLFPSVSQTLVCWKCARTRGTVPRGCHGRRMGDPGRGTARRWVQPSFHPAFLSFSPHSLPTPFYLLLLWVTEQRVPTILNVLRVRGLWVSKVINKQGLLC